MPIRLQYRVRCLTEDAFVYEYDFADVAVPTVCPNNAGHTIDATQTAITERELDYPGTTDPTVDDDESRGYLVGSKWTNDTDGREWICVDNTDGAAVWQSVEVVTFTFGRTGPTAAGSFYRSVDGKTMSASSGYQALYNGIVTAFGYRRADTDSATFEIYAEGASIYTLVSTALSGQETAIGVAFSQGENLSVKNQSGGNTTSDVTGWFSVKWRI